MTIRKIKKYPNRRLYDMQERCYINIKDIKTAIINFENIMVEDSKTGDDITASILLQVLAEQKTKDDSDFITNITLCHLIRLLDSPMAQQNMYWLEQIMGWYTQQQKTMHDFQQKHINFVSPLSPFMRDSSTSQDTTQQDITTQWQKQWQNMMQQMMGHPPSKKPDNESSA